jgi:hypothetical protein
MKAVWPETFAEETNLRKPPRPEPRYLEWGTFLCIAISFTQLL